MGEARKRLEGVLDDLHFTSEHWTEAEGNATGLYLNQLATGVSTLGVDELNQQLKEIEQLLDRKHDKSGVVSIDIDLLQYDGTRYHLRDWERNYVKDLLPEL